MIIFFFLIEKIEYASSVKMIKFPDATLPLGKVGSIQQNRCNFLTNVAEVFA